jgi:hypothetical protein
MKKRLALCCAAAPLGARVCVNAPTVRQVSKWVTIMNLNSLEAFDNTGPKAFYPGT